MNANLPVATQAEIAQMSREQLVERCLALASRLEGKPAPGQPVYMLTPDGYMMYQDRTVSLTTNGGGLTFIKGVGTVIDALGWDKINEVLRVHVYVNPNAEVITENGTARAVRVSGVAIGSVGGVPQAHALSLTFAFYEMFLGELVHKVRYVKTAGAMGVVGQRPAGFDNRPLQFFNIESGAGVWVDVSHDEIIAIMKTLQDRRSKPDRAAYTFLKRNLIRSFAGGISQKAGGADDRVSKIDVPVRGFYFPMTRERLEAIAKGALKGTQVDKAVEVRTAPVERIASADEAETVETELVDTETGAVVPASDIAPAQPVEPPKPPAPQPPTERDIKFNACRDAFAMLTAEQKKRIKAKFPGDMNAKTKDELTAILDAIREAAMRTEKDFFNPQ